MQNSDEDFRMLLNERHETILAAIDEMKENIKLLFNRLNWFYVICILTLGAQIANFAMNHIGKDSKTNTIQSNDAKYVKKGE